MGGGGVTFHHFDLEVDFVKVCLIWCGSPHQGSDSGSAGEIFFMTWLRNICLFDLFLDHQSSMSLCSASVRSVLPRKEHSEESTWSHTHSSEMKRVDQSFTVLLYEPASILQLHLLRAVSCKGCQFAIHWYIQHSLCRELTAPSV